MDRKRKRHHWKRKTNRTYALIWEHLPEEKSDDNEADLYELEIFITMKDCARHILKQAWWHTPVISALVKLRQENH
jgi:hypothetical protein